MVRMESAKPPAELAFSGPRLAQQALRTAFRDTVTARWRADVA